MDIRLTSHATHVALIFGRLGEQAIPKATAKAINEVAFAGMRESKIELAKSMRMRNRFSAAGIQVEKADPNQSRIAAEVGIDERRDYLTDHVVGAKRPGGRFGRAIPEDETLRSASGKVPAQKRPAAMLAKIRRAERQASLTRTFGGRKGKDKRQPFLIHSQRWGGDLIVRRKDGRQYPLQVIYAFRKDVRIRPTFHMPEAVERKAQALYDGAFFRAIEREVRKLRQG